MTLPGTMRGTQAAHCPQRSLSSPNATALLHLRIFVHSQEFSLALSLFGETQRLNSVRTFLSGSARISLSSTSSSTRRSSCGSVLELAMGGQEELAGEM